jgi:hypothetical protein
LANFWVTEFNHQQMKKTFLIATYLWFNCVGFGQIRTPQNNTQSITLIPGGVSIKTGSSNIEDNNVSVGRDSLKFNQINSQIGIGNVAVGTESLRDNTLAPNGMLPYGIYNTAIGHGSMNQNRGGNWNTAIGTNTLTSALNAKNNVAIGYSAAHHLNSRDNVAIGNFALSGGHYGNRNTVIGTYAGDNLGAINNTQVSANVFIGYSAGAVLGNKTNKLFIANSNTISPLIWGDFHDKKLGFHGKVGIGTKNPIDLLTVHDSTGSIPESYLRFTNNFSGIGGSDGLRIGLSEFMSGVIWHYEDKPLVFGTNNSSRMTIHENGRVGLGIQNPQANLQIYQNTGASSLLLNTSYSGSGVTDGLLLYLGQFNSSIVNRENNILYVGTNNTNIVTLHPNGFFGLGLNGLPASSDLHIHKQSFANSELRLTNLSSGYENTDGFTVTMKNGGELEMRYKEEEKVVFQTNTSSTPELVLNTNGNFGLGVNNATAKLEVNGFTKLGTDAPAVKFKRINTTSPSTEGGSINLDHLINPAKILAIKVLLEYNTSQYIPPSYDGNPSYWFDWYCSGDKIYIKTKAGSSSSILSKPIKIIITYEE